MAEAATRAAGVAVAAGLGLVLCVGQGCATVLGGGASDKVTVRTNPSGATVRIYNHRGAEVHRGVAPFTVRLRRGSGYFKPGSYLVDAEAPSLPPRNLEVNARLNPWYVGNAIFGLAIGAVGLALVDPMTGAMWNLPNEVYIDLSVRAASGAAPAKSISR